MALRKNLKDYFNEYSFRRKFVHVFGGILFVIFINLNYPIIQNNLLLMLIVSLIIAVLFSAYAKYQKPRFLMKIIELFDKPQDMISYPGRGAVYFIIGALFVIVFFDRSIASAALLILVIGDPAAHFVGKYYGRKRLIVNPKKLLEGTIAGTVFGTIAAMLFVPFPIAFFGAAFGMMAEAFELEMFHLDDNFFIPFVSSIVMAMIESLV